MSKNNKYLWVYTTKQNEEDNNIPKQDKFQAKKNERRRQSEASDVDVVVVVNRRFGLHFWPLSVGDRRASFPFLLEKAPCATLTSALSP